MGDVAKGLRRAIDAWNRGDLAAYLEIYDPNVVLHGAPPGLDGVRATYERIWRLFPGSTLELDESRATRTTCREPPTLLRTPTAPRARFGFSPYGRIGQ